jgi:glycosyltransferase involved in cell wall biosynthesis
MITVPGGTESAAAPSPVSVILIAYNEAETIAKEVEGFYRAVVEKVPGSELIVAEDGSRDGTSKILKDLAARLPIRLVQGAERKGYKRALLDALRLPRREWVLFSDTGGKFRPEDFWKLAARRQDADLIVAVKVSRRDQWYRRLMTRVFSFLVSRYFGVRVRDIDSGLRLFRRELAQAIASEELVFRDLINAEITLRMLSRGARFREVEVVATPRPNQSRGMPPRRIPGVILHILFSFPRLKRALRASPASAE